jgi:hypothetical protein
MENPAGRHRASPHIIALQALKSTMDPYRALFLRQVRSIINSKPSPEALDKLLITVSPELTEDDTLNGALKRKRAFKELQLRIHPDKHPDDKESATELFQGVQDFHNKCSAVIGSPKKKKKTCSPTSVISFPTEFKVTDTWGFLAATKNQPTAPSRESITEGENTLEMLLAYRCLNARGAIAYGAPTECTFGWDVVAKKSKLHKGAEALFRRHYKGARKLEGVAEIKEELTTRGPVVSTSFVLSAGFAKSTESSQSFFMEKIDHVHPLLIVGWKLTACGEVWLVSPPQSDGDLIPVATGQFGIDDLCVAPESDLTEVEWQKGPHFDLDLSKWPMEWTSWANVQFCVDSSKLEKLNQCFKGGFVAAKEQRMRFVIRDKTNRSNSRAVCLTEVEWDEEKKMWDIDCEAL